MRHSILGATVIAVALAASTTSLSTAQPKKPAGAAAKKSEREPRPAVDVEAFRRELESGDEERIVTALSGLKDAAEQGPLLAPLVEALLRRGATPRVSVAAIGAAAVLEQPSSTPVLAPYVRHRDPAIRRAAVRALPRTGGPEAVQALILGLRSPDAAVRGLAATGLGQLRASAAVGPLLQAFEQNVAEAAPAIGKLCAPAECDRLVSTLGRLPFDAVTAGLEEILLRSDAAVDDAYKLSVLQKLAALGTAEVRRFLVGLEQRWPEDASPRVKQAISQALHGGSDQ